MQRSSIQARHVLQPDGRELDSRSEALFASELQPSDVTAPDQIRTAILGMIRLFGERGCAARVAQEFGDHPDTAVPRMRWAREAASQAYAPIP